MLTLSYRISVLVPQVSWKAKNAEIPSIWAFRVFGSILFFKSFLLPDQECRHNAIYFEKMTSFMISMCVSYSTAVFLQHHLRYEAHTYSSYLLLSLQFQDIIHLQSLLIGQLVLNISSFLCIYPPTRDIVNPMFIHMAIFMKSSLNVQIHFLRIRVSY